MSLNGAQKKQLREVMESAFKDEELERLFREELNHPLDGITKESSLTNVVSEAIEWAGRHGRTEELIRAIQGARQNREDIKGVTTSLLSALGSTKPQDGFSATPSKGISTEVDPRRAGALSEERRLTDEQDEHLIVSYRRSIRNRLEVLLGELVRGEVRGSRILARLAVVLEIVMAPDDESQLRERILDDLIDAKDEDAIPRMIRLHAELCEENADQHAELIAECVNRILPLHFSPRVIREARRQIRVQKVALIEGTVETETGAEVVMAHLDGEPPSFQYESPIPRGKHSVPLELPAIGDPSSEAEVLAILDDLAKSAGVPPSRVVSADRREADAARMEHFTKVLRGHLKAVKPSTGRRPYCALVMPRESGDREHRKKVLEKVHDRIPQLVFLELCPESETSEQEYFFIKCLNTRMESERKRKTETSR